MQSRKLRISEKHQVRLFLNHAVSARHVTKINLIHIKNTTNDVYVRTCHFASYSMEGVNDPEDFF